MYISDFLQTCSARKLELVKKFPATDLLSRANKQDKRGMGIGFAKWRAAEVVCVSGFNHILGLCTVRFWKLSS